MSGRPSQEWAPIVYGRTRYADMWWRVLPSGETARGALAGLVLATVGGGSGLDLRPRFVLSRGTHGLLVGVACDAAAISETMARQGGRPLYTFVGWLGPAQGWVPPYEAWTQHWQEWARPTYERWVSLDWELPKHEITGPRPAKPERPDWGPVGDSADDPAGDTVAGTSWWRAAKREAVWLLPAAAAASTWDAAREAKGPFCLTTGWRWGRQSKPGQITHLCAEDVPEPELVRVTVPVPSSTPSAASGGQASDADQVFDAVADQQQAWLVRVLMKVPRWAADYVRRSGTEPPRSQTEPSESATGSNFDRVSGPIVPKMLPKTLPESVPKTLPESVPEAVPTAGAGPAPAPKELSGREKALDDYFGTPQPYPEGTDA